MNMPMPVFIGMLVSFLLTVVAAIVVAVVLDRKHKRKLRLMEMLSEVPFSEWSVKVREWMVPIIHDGVLPDNKGMNPITYALKEEYSTKEELLTSMLVDWDIQNNVFKGIYPMVGVTKEVERGVEFEYNCCSFFVSYEGFVEMQKPLNDSPCRYRDFIKDLETWIQGHPKFKKLQELNNEDI